MSKTQTDELDKDVTRLINYN